MRRRAGDGDRGYWCRYRYWRLYRFRLRKAGGVARRDGADATWTLAWTFDYSIVTG
jgi:hypothetical protein